jgi:hypothetical protein
MRKFLLAVSVLPLFIVAASAQKKLDPCTLVSKADVQAIVGSAVGDFTPNKTNPAVCDIKIGDLGSAGFTAQEAGPGSTPDRIIAELNKRKIKTVDAPGIGDRAFFAEHGMGMVQLNGFKGKNYVIVTMMMFGAPADKQKAIAGKLMQKALAKL